MPNPSSSSSAASIALLFVVAAAIASFVAQPAAAQQANAPAINWPTVQPIHSVPSFFDDFPVLQRIHARHQPLTSFLEGTTTQRNQFRFQAALVLNRTDGLGYCGGSLIHQQWVLTAAHCLDGVISGTVILGVHQVRNAAEVGQLRIAVNQFFPHPGWNGLRLADDVGLVRLPQPVQFNANIAAVRLSNFRQVPSTYVQQQVTLNGFGRGLFAPATFEVGVRSSLMRVISARECAVRQPELVLESSQFCAEPLTGRQCPADAGGPLTVTEADGVLTQIGVTSFVTGLGCSARPAVFTRLNFYLRWIHATTGIPIADDFVF